MQKLFFIVIIILSFVLNNWGQEYQWALVSHLDQSELKSIHFNNEYSGWAVGAHGRIYHSVDGGYNWTNQNIESIFHLVSVFSIDTNTAFCLTENGAVFKTVNAGITWEQTRNIDTNFTDCTNISFANIHNGWIFTTEISDPENEIPFPTMYHTIDGGTTWNKIFVDKEGLLIRGGIIGGDESFSIFGTYAINPESNRDLKGMILSSFDNGQSWVELFNDTIVHDVTSISYIDNLNIWAIGDYYSSSDPFGYPQKKIIKTSDGGVLWNEVTGHPSFGYNDILFINHDVGWLCGQRNIIETRDDGISWYQFNFPYENDFKSLFFISDTLGWAHDGLTVFRYDKNIPPIPFGLIKPENNISHKEFDIHFEWELSTYSYNDPTYYDLIIYNDFQDTIISDIQHNAYLFHGSKFFIDSIQYFWTVIASDGKFNTSATDTFYFNFITTTDTTDTNDTPTTLESNFNQSPETNMLHQNYPNPFNSSTLIRYSLKSENDVRITIFDVMGRIIESFVHPSKPAGEYTFTFNALGLPSGIYICQLQAHKFKKSKKMLLIR